MWLHKQAGLMIALFF